MNRKYMHFLFLFILLGLCSCVNSQNFEYTQAQFPPQYIAENKGKWTIEVPEVQELVHIIFAITEKGIADKDMVEHETPYYQKVMNYFKPFQNEAIVKKINKKLKGSFFMNGIGAYARLKMDACGFYFDGDKIVKDSHYEHLNWDNKNYIKEYIPELMAFAQKTNFRIFFIENKFYYDSLITVAKQQLKIDNQWHWLEERFPNRYDHYRITFSPLVNGSHSTNRFECGDFKQTVMFICRPFYAPKLNPQVAEGFTSRIVFTEIDHNYINPITDKYKSHIDKIFSNRAKWASSPASKSYGNPYSVFNEYMTYAVFSLYAQEVYSETIFKDIIQRTENQMVKNRGFDKFKEFNQKLLALYGERKEKNLETYYPLILDWCARQ